jgi:transposase
VDNLLRLKLTPGNISDIGELLSLIKGMSAKALLADKGDDSNAVVELALAGGMEAIIPSRSNRKLPRPMDWARYMVRHLVEDLFQRLKIFRRVATRFEKLNGRFMGVVYIAGIMKWIH